MNLGFLEGVRVSAGFSIRMISLRHRGALAVSTPRLAFCARFVGELEPPCGHARAEFAVERFDEGVVRGLAWPAQVEGQAAHVCTQVELPADELRGIFDAVGLQ